MSVHISLHLNIGGYFVNLTNGGNSHTKKWILQARKKGEGATHDSLCTGRIHIKT